VKVAVNGAGGKMGSRIIALISEFTDMALAAAIERPEHPFIGKDVAEVVGTRQKEIIIIDSIYKLSDPIDMIIDFTSPASTVECIRWASEKGVSVVSGTTGLTEEEKKEIKDLSGKIPCVYAPNMSVGINLLLKVLEQVSPIIGDDYDIEIIEAHHRLKKDAPSGTAMKMAEVISQALHRNLEEVARYSRHGLIGQRSQKEIGMQTIRAGDIVGEHTVLFGTIGERIEFTHKASSRDTFARGALRAAQWLYGKKPGLYDMHDVLSLKYL
jgi:4-hydroxy-tetrahydrodipicolinate reductase